MLIAIILALFLGILAGTLTGIFPGIHINLVAISLISFSTFFLAIVSPLILVVFIVAMSITHTFVDFIPSIFLGAPDEDTLLSTLPGHRFLLNGKAHEAVILTLKGGILALILVLIFTPLFILFLPRIYQNIQAIMPFILIIVSIFLIYTEKNKKLRALIIFLLAGFLGIAVLHSNLKEPLLPLLTGLFGTSNIIISIKQKTKIPTQEISRLKEIKLSKKSLLKTTFASLISAPLTSFLPGLGASQAAVIGSEVTGDLSPREFLFLIGALNTIVMGLSFIALYSINKTRTGSALAVSKLIEMFNFDFLISIILTMIFSGIIAFIISINISKAMCKKISKINYSYISLSILILLILISFYFSGFLGLLILLVSTALGIATIQLEIKRMHLMGCLLIPTILSSLV
ncbi:MAG: tripartite tricarboxylate transporter permease [Candidatus Pacearchaeota archaeon]